MRSAYLGEPQRKAQVLERLHALAKEDAWAMRPVYWSAKGGSIVGNLLQSEDLDEWERRFGLPKWLALLVDTLFASAPDLPRAVESGMALLQAVPIGEDLTAAGHRILVEFLAGREYGVRTSLPEDRPPRALATVVGLHDRAIRGDPVTPEEWRLVRRQAVAETDHAPEHSLEAEFGSCIEAAAWNPSQSRTSVSDTCRKWMGAMVSQSFANDPEWTLEDDALTKTRLEQLYAQEVKLKGEGERIDVFKLLGLSHPEHAARLRAHNAFKRQCVTEQWFRANQLVKDVLETGEAR